VSTLLLQPENTTASTQGLWGTVEFWAEESGIPEEVVRERLATHHPRLMRVRGGGGDYFDDVYSEAIFLEACADLLIAHSGRSQD
jgi:hypothetical protein